MQCHPALTLSGPSDDGFRRRALGERGVSLVDILMALALLGVIAGIAVPVTGTAISTQKFDHDVKAVAHMVGLAKMRASATFTRARVRANLTDRTFALEVWNKNTNTWVQEGTSTPLSSGVAFGFGTVATAPPNTQTTIGNSPACRVGTTLLTATIGNTACVVFNSRGLPVDGGGLTYGAHALYLTDGSSVGATTVTATPRIRRWRIWSKQSGATWRQQQ